MKQPREVPAGAQYWDNGDRSGEPRWWKLDESGWSAMMPHVGAWCPRNAPDAAWLERIACHENHSVEPTEKVGQKYDQGKPMMGLIPPRAEMAVAEVLTFGAQKYSPDNWRHVDDLERRYTDAALRHINAYRQRHVHDQESRMPHLAHAICCLMFMLEVDLEGTKSGH